MTKRYLVAILALFMMIQTTGCTSGGGQGDGDVAESNDGSFSEESNGDYAGTDAPVDGATDTASGDAPIDAGAEKTDTVAENLDDLGAPPADAAPVDGAATDIAASDAGAAPAAGGDELSLDTAEPLPDAAATDPAAAGAAPLDAAAPGAVAANDQPPPTDAPVFNAPADAAAGTTPPADAQPPGTDVAAAPAPDATTPVADAAATAAAPAADAAPAAPHVYAPYKKMREQAYAAKDGTSLNRVYLARSGDSMKSISQKIYGKNRKKDLVAWNGKSSVTTGDKVYYASPNDANDTSMKTYYEDIGVQPSTYTSKDGDNIRKVSKQLLGSGQSWKEVWATNPTVESKGDIPAGLEIRYWPEGSEAGAAPTMANNGKGKHEVANADTTQDLPPPPSDLDMGGAPAGKDLAMNDIPPPSATGAMPGGQPGANMSPPPPPNGMNPSMPHDAGAAGTVAGAAGAANTMPPPPPPPDIPAPAPPEPKPVAKKMAAPDKMASTDSDPDQMMWLGAGGIMLMAAAVLYVVIKKNRAKRVDLSQTQV